MFGIKGNSASKTGYACMMQALIEEWRELWSATENTTDKLAPFGLVTLATTGGEGANGDAMGAMRLAQTGGYGVLPNAAMPNTFLAQAYDLDDEWVSLGGGGKWRPEPVFVRNVRWAKVLSFWSVVRGIDGGYHLSVGPCLDYGYNQSSPAYHCCDVPFNATLCPPSWATQCTNMCAALMGTTQYMGGLHPRSKR